MYHNIKKLEHKILPFKSFKFNMVYKQNAELGIDEYWDLLDLIRSEMLVPLPKMFWIKGSYWRSGHTSRSPPSAQQA